MKGIDYVQEGMKYLICLFAIFNFIFCGGESEGRNAITLLNIIFR